MTGSREDVGGCGKNQTLGGVVAFWVGSLKGRLCSLAHSLLLAQGLVCSPRVFWHLPSRLPAAAPGACLGEGFLHPHLDPFQKVKGSVFQQPAFLTRTWNKVEAWLAGAVWVSREDGATLAPAAPAGPEQVLPSSSCPPTPGQQMKRPPALSR